MAGHTDTYTKQYGVCVTERRGEEEETLALFCSVLGAVAGNLALAILATGGVYVAGGIAPRLIPYLQNGLFREAFDSKGRLHTLVERFPAFVVTHPQVGLVGAAAAAAAM